MNFRQQNSLTLGILSQIPLLSGSLSNSLTFPGFPGQWQPCKAVTFQQFFNWFCFVPLWFSLSNGFASWEGSLALPLAFYGQNKTDQMWLVCLQQFRFKWNSDVIMKYLFKKTIQSIFLENKCKMSEKQLEQLPNPYAYNLKKSQSLIGHSLLRLTKLSSLETINKQFYKDGRNRGFTLPARKRFSGPKKT